MEVFISDFYIYPKRNILFECIPYYKLTHNSKSCVPKVTKLFIFYQKDLSQKHRHKETELVYTVHAGWNLDSTRCTCNEKLTSWKQSSYTALSCIISLLSRQQTTKTQIRLHGCAGWSASLLFTYDKNSLSHDVAHFQINRSYLCRIRRKRVCCIEFYGEKKNNNNCWFTIVGVICCRGFIEHKFALTPSICVRNGTMRLFV